MSVPTEQTARARRVWDKSAPGYDRQIAFFERNWFAGGRQCGVDGRPGAGNVVEQQPPSRPRLKAGTTERIHARRPATP